MSTCCKCGDDLKGGIYIGTPGHCPPNVCFDCWVVEWHLHRHTAAIARHGQKALFLYYRLQGHTQREAAGLIGIGERTGRLWEAKATEIGGTLLLNIEQHYSQFHADNMPKIKPAVTRIVRQPSRGQAAIAKAG